MLNVRDECDLPEDDGYDLFTRETEVERRFGDKPRPGTSGQRDGKLQRIESGLPIWSVVSKNP